jgi:hypothetical protein
MLPERVLTNFRLSTDAVAMLAELKVAKGIGKTAVLETAIRVLYKQSSADLKRARQMGRIPIAVGQAVTK